MKRLAGFILPIAIMTSLANMPANGNELYGKPTITVARPQTVIQKGPVLAKRLAKPKLFRANPHHVKYFVDDDSNDDGIDDDGFITGYRREDLQKVYTDATPNNPEGLSDDVQWKLFLIRTAVMLKHQEKWA